MKVKTYKLKSTKIKAIKFTRDTFHEIQKWIGIDITSIAVPKCPGCVASLHIYPSANTNYSNLILQEGEYLIQDASGHFSSSSEHNFNITYEEDYANTRKVKW